MSQPLYFPTSVPVREEASFPNLQWQDSQNPPKSFEKACQLAMECSLPLILTENVVLQETIRLRQAQELILKGALLSGNRVKISGDLHSLFLLNNKSRLEVEHIDLDHTLQSDDHKQVGAAINLRYKGSASVRSSRVSSACGFAIWAVQKSQVKLDDCELLAPARSAVVCFGQAECHMWRCHLDQPGVHGLCARGACRIELMDCQVTGSAARGIYAYANASVRLQGCHVSGTMHPGKAAIEVSTIGCNSDEGLSSALTLQDCRIVDNNGTGIRLKGPVHYQIEGVNILERNGLADWEILDGIDDEQNNEQQGTGMIPPLRRDASGTSFRRGDWLCLNCLSITAARAQDDDQVGCRACSTPKATGGRLLTIDEIRRCNQGIDIRVGQGRTTTRFARSSDHDSTSSCRKLFEWQFDGDDKGWLPYDAKSAQLLEEVYQRVFTDNLVKQSKNDSCVFLEGGRYEVNLETMKQVNTETDFLRLVRRRIIADASR